MGDDKRRRFYGAMYGAIADQRRTRGEEEPKVSAIVEAAATENPVAALYEAALSVVDGLMRLDPPKDSPHGRLLLSLARAIEEYEEEELVLPEPTPEEAAAFRRDQETPR